jgi:hypothetical protein
MADTDAKKATMIVSKRLKRKAAAGLFPTVATIQ